ncbi:hydroxyethylthiazole kinase [Roseibium hamelinense]|uniref:Hydroxyethylthiazole kinase n=1 Tax=Roseibium hamelinense TaxID=150831 RepID=A0A562TAT5_9HYPH|nr:hydroxyethylthiazole kinase [Roseibium hamelinense]MTI45309.1 hydroxyethylthiazole kinase [Roseibium hamelinense]TWI90324.1 hydroxyethylthiazole kinase [Roseibium hamelinense]
MLNYPGLCANTIADLLDRVRTNAPRVHVITNTVAQSFTANAVLAVGAVPSMTIAPEEAAQFSASANALLVNLGTLDEGRKAAIPLAWRAAQDAGNPIVLDPVFINRSPVRLKFAEELVEHRPTIVRVNPAELDALFGPKDGLLKLKEKGIAVALTGATDYIACPNQHFRLSNGHPVMSKVTATGCAGGAVLAAFLAVDEDHCRAAAAGLSVFNIAGEIAGEATTGPGSFVPAFLDTLYTLTPEQVETRLKLGTISSQGRNR